MKTNRRLVVAVIWIASIGICYPGRVPALELGEGEAETSPAAPGSPSLRGGFASILDQDLRQERLDKAFAHIEKAEYDKARILFELILRNDPGDLSAQVGLAVIHTKNYEYAEALQILEKLIGLYPNNPAILNNAAWIYATADDREVRDGHRAVNLARQALVATPGNYHVWSTMSEGYYITGQFEEAFEAAKEALQMASKAKADSDNLREYRAQFLKSRRAVQALTLLE